jgi:hypothetical protein
MCVNCVFYRKIACLSQLGELLQNALMNRKTAAPKSGVSNIQRRPLRVTRAEYTSTEQSEVEARLFRMFDLLHLDRELFAPLAEPRQKGRM